MLVLTVFSYEADRNLCDPHVLPQVLWGTGRPTHTTLIKKHHL